MKRSLTFTVSKDDFKDYFECPKKLALRLMGYKARESDTKHILTSPAYKIGISGERLTEQILEIIAELQAEKPTEEVKVFVERGEKEKEIIKQLADIGSKEGFQSPIIKKHGDELVGLTFEEIFGEDLKAYKEELMKRISSKFSELLGELYTKLPKIKSVYKPILKNRDFCSLGYPDFQIDSEKGQMLIEVKNWASLNKSLKLGNMDLLYYNSVLADKTLSASTHFSEKLPQPTNSLLIIPRFGVVREVDEKIPNYRETAVEVWKIKRAALVEGKLPHVVPVSAVCKRCGFKKYCQAGGESLEKAKPLPLLYAIAYQEAEEKIERLREKTLKLLTEFWRAYFTLEKEAEQGNQEALRKLELLETYELQRMQSLEKREQRIIYRTLPNEFDDWGGMKILRDYYLKISRTSNMLYPQKEEKIKEIIRIARKKWDI